MTQLRGVEKEERIPRQVQKPCRLTPGCNRDLVCAENKISKNRGLTPKHQEKVFSYHCAHSMEPLGASKQIGGIMRLGLSEFS